MLNSNTIKILTEADKYDIIVIEVFMKNAKEKLKLVKDLEMVFTSKWEFDAFFDFFEKICISYRDLYVKPYFGAFGKHLAPMKFDRTPPQKVTENDETYYTGGFAGFYQPEDNTVTMHIGILINIDDDNEASYNGFTIQGILEMLSAVGHEYEHNFQYKGGEVAEQFAENKERFRAKINAITDKYAYELGEIETDWNPDKEEIQALLEMTDSYKEFDTFRSKDRIVDVCSSAVYYNRYLEVDARSVQRKIFNTFIKDTIKLTKNKKFIGLLKSVSHFMKFWDEHVTETKYYFSDGSYYKKYVDVIDKLSKKDYIEYAKTVIKAMDKEYYEQLKQHIENGQPFPKEDYIYGQFERDILTKAFFFFGDKSMDKTMFSKDINANKALNLQLAFLKFGVPVEDYLLSQRYNFVNDEKDKLLEKYFDMLKNGNISFNSFFKVNELSLDQQKELLYTYLNRGQTEFVSSMLYEVEWDKREALLTGDLNPKHAFTNNILDQIEKKLYRMALDLENKNNKKPLKYDDINDILNMLSHICQITGVPYYDETIDLTNCSKDVSQEFSKKLHELYVLAEKVGYDTVCKIDGIKPRPDAYRYAHPVDRQKYVVEGQDADERRKVIYGPIAIYQEQWEEELSKNNDSIIAGL